MLNEERIILMTQMASYEENEGKKNEKIGNYFRSDYITIQVMKSVVYATLAYAACFALYILYDFETFMQNIYNIDLIAFAINALKYYGITVVVYCVISYVVYTYKYAKAKKSLKCYFHNLKKLSSMYKEQE